MVPGTLRRGPTNYYNRDCRPKKPRLYHYKTNIKENIEYQEFLRLQEEMRVYCDIMLAIFVLFLIYGTASIAIN